MLDLKGAREAAAMNRSRETKQVRKPNGRPALEPDEIPRSTVANGSRSRVSAQSLKPAHVSGDYSTGSVSIHFKAGSFPVAIFQERSICAPAGYTCDSVLSSPPSVQQ